MASSAPSPEVIKTHADNIFAFLESNKYACKHKDDLEDYYNMVYKQRNPSAVFIAFRDVWCYLKKYRKVENSPDNKIFVLLKKNIETEPTGTGNETGNNAGNKNLRSHSLSTGFTEGNIKPDELNTKSSLKCFQCKELTFKTEEELYEHKRTNRHFVEFLKYWLKRNQRELVQDKCGVTIACVERKADLNIIFNPNEEVVLTFRIYNKGTGGYSGKVQFRFCQLLHKLEYITLSDQHNITNGYEPFLILPATEYFVKLKIKSPDVGQWAVPLAFQFCLSDQYEPFHIIRCIQLNCSNETISSLLPSEQYLKPEVVKCKPPAKIIIKGVPLPSQSRSLFRLFAEREMLPISIPDKLTDLVEHDLKPWDEMTPQHTKLLRDIMSYVDTPLNYEIYVHYFKTMLSIEHVQMDVDIRSYDMKEAIVERVGQKLVLEVPGLEEGRPSVLRGDDVFLSLDYVDKEYAGTVHDIQSSKVFLGVDDELLDQHIPGMKFDVRFTFNTMPYKLMHRALQLAEDTNLWPVLFPSIETAAISSELIDSNNIVFYNRNIESNPEQATAVINIVKGVSRPAPYLLFGPPGTGKTVTLVESIKQVWKMFPESRILICTPSNSAADLITDRLLAHIPKRDVLRMYSASYTWNKIPEKIKPCSNYDEKHQGFFFPSKKEIQDGHRILLCTLVTSGRLASACFEENFFTHIFIDESGHSLEPESIIPAAGLLKCYEFHEGDEELGGQLVLAGDPKQLGPVLRSPIVLNHGLDLSLLERLMNCDVYQRRNDGHFDSRVLTKLIRNYRSHPAILKLPNELFYDGELQALEPFAKKHPICLWDYLPQKGFPVLFHSVIGEDVRDQHCPSYFNPQEISVVLTYVDMLLSVKKFKLKQEDIGIVTPYRRQVIKIKNKLQDMQLANITVGSVEEFQGQERKVIIISSVRSCPDLLSMDFHHKLGFLANPKRFNVAITRAKYLLITVGNPRILSKDKHWNELLKYCRENKSYLGTPLRPMDEEEIQDLIERFKPFGLNKFKHWKRRDKMRQRIPISLRTLQEDPPWKDGT